MREGIALTRSRWAIALLAAAMVAPGPAPAHAEEPPAEAPGADDAPKRPPVKPPSRRNGSTVARIVAPTFARARLKSRKRGWRVRTQTAWSGQAQRLLVLKAARRDGREWVKVLLAERPNGSAGWVPRDRVALSRTRYWVDVRTGSRRVTVYRDGKRVRRFRAVVGTPGTPTPHT